MYKRCQTEREDKLSQLKGKVKNCYKAEKEKHRETKMAYVDIAPKAPRSIQKAQVLNTYTTCILNRKQHVYGDCIGH